MTQLGRLNAQAEAGNVAAEKELMKQMDRLRHRDQQQQIAPAPTKSTKLGKKEAAKAVANEVRGLYEPPAAPARLNCRGINCRAVGSTLVDSLCRWGSRSEDHRGGNEVVRRVDIGGGQF